MFGKKAKLEEEIEKKIEEKIKVPEPKFKVRDIVFVLKDGKAVEQRVRGIFCSYSDDFKPWDSASCKNLEFKEYQYFFEIKRSPQPYSWLSEKNVFKTKEELISSL